MVYLVSMRIGFFLKFFDPTDSPPSRDLLYAFYLGSKFDLRLSLFTVFPPAILSVIPWANPFKYQWFKWVWLIWFISTFLIITLVYILDFGNYSFLEMRIDASFLRFFHDTQTSLTMVLESYPVVLISCLLIIGIWSISYGFNWGFNKISISEIILPISRTKKIGLRKIGMSTGLILLMLFGMYGKMSWYPLRWSEAFFSNNNFVSSLALNPVLFFIQTYKNRTVESDIETAQEAYPTISKYLGVQNPDIDALNYLRTIENLNPALKNKNVILVILESFAFYKTGLSGNPLHPTPEFDNIASEGILFDRFYTPHAGTARSVFTAITGIPDIELNETSTRNPLIVDQHTIANEFKGYEKLYFLGGSANWGQIRGLLSHNITNLKIYEEGSYTSPRIDAWGISDLDLFSEAVDVLAKQQQPFFSIIQTSGNHSPFTLPEHTEGFEKVTYSEDELTPYGFTSIEALNSFRFMDFSIGRLIEKAKTKSFFNDTLFVFIGDHGLIRSADHMFAGEEKLLLTQGHVPLLFYSPKHLKPTVIDQVSGEVDVLPTIASLTLPEYRNNTLGRDLFDPASKNNQHAFIIRHQYGPEIGMIGKEYLFRIHANGQNKQLYKIYSDMPEENLVEQEPGRAKQMEELTSSYYETIKYLRYNNTLSE